MGCSFYLDIILENDIPLETEADFERKFALFLENILGENRNVITRSGLVDTSAQMLQTIGLPACFKDKDHLRFSCKDGMQNELYDSGVLNKIFNNIINSSLFNYIIEMDSSSSGGIRFDGVSHDYYCNSFQMFLEAVVHQRWGYKLTDEAMLKLKKHLTEKNILKSDGSVLDQSELGKPKLRDKSMTGVWIYCTKNFKKYKVEVELDKY
jgi:hypothetical protein